MLSIHDANTSGVTIAKRIIMADVTTPVKARIPKLMCYERIDQGSGQVKMIECKQDESES